MNHTTRRLCLSLSVLICTSLAVHAQTASGVSKTAISLGQTTALTGASSALALPFHQGAKLYFDRINAAGGINGRSINFTALDDGGNPATARANAQKLVQGGVLALFGTYGSAQTTAAYEALKASDVILFAPMAAADELQGANFPNLYTMRPGYSEEALAMVRHSQTLGARKISVAHGRDVESLSALDASKRTMQALGDFLGEGTLDNLDKLLSSRPDAVLVVGTPQEAGKAIRELRSKGFRGAIYGFSNTGESLLAEQLGGAGAGVVLARVTPRSDNAKSVVVRELLEDAQAAKLGKPNVYMLEGYIAARALADGIRKAGKEPTPAKLRKAIENINEWDMGGFRVNFGGGRNGSKIVELSLIDSQGKVRE
ncbi:ABC transporter substrate-binding protein [Variovorax sp. PCZ-1]|uniref:ABC transporter substrate-binding protein n=1 Tax=Variovorax sp. PCZ-1 TaxID=2835533 RepID=UPI0020BF0C56|nr:ABC transporter substrate-binding protein [Variovorax sp. PCZ-1]